TLTADSIPAASSAVCATSASIVLMNWRTMTGLVSVMSPLLRAAEDARSAAELREPFARACECRGHLGRIGRLRRQPRGHGRFGCNGPEDAVVEQVVIPPPVVERKR